MLLTKMAGQQRLHNYTIGKLWDYIRALEATIKIVGFETSLSYTRLTPHQYRPTCCCGSRSNGARSGSILLRQKLSYSVSPQHFSEDKVINPTDPLKVSIVWYEFKEMLETHYPQAFRRQRSSDQVRFLLDGR